MWVISFRDDWGCWLLSVSSSFLSDAVVGQGSLVLAVYHAKYGCYLLFGALCFTVISNSNPGESSNWFYSSFTSVHYHGGTDGGAFGIYACKDSAPANHTSNLPAAKNWRCLKCWNSKNYLAIFNFHDTWAEGSSCHLSSASPRDLFLQRSKRPILGKAYFFSYCGFTPFIACPASASELPLSVFLM